MNSNRRLTALHSITVLHSFCRDDSRPFRRTIHYPLYESRLSHMPCTLFEPTELQDTIHYPLSTIHYPLSNILSNILSTPSVETTVDLPLAEFQPTITALNFVYLDDSRPSAALLRCTETNEFQLIIQCDLSVCANPLLPCTLSGGPIGSTSVQ
jgi:hypothetical protein